MKLLWLLNDTGTHVRFCWIASHCGIKGNERVEQLAKETLDHAIEPLASVHYTDFKALANSYIHQLFQIKWHVAVHGRCVYLLKPTLAPPKKSLHLTRAEEVLIIRFESTILRPPRPTSSPEDRPLLVTIVVKLWPLTICSCGRFY